ncbi:MAG: ATP-binding protein [Epsilonproteobacteria bacterium]|nr:ATP-binding protein [Campylobacterota bacterium]OIO17643.1 MAG: ATPase [Helicobacteraceae bacterium CG1_02_36_14]PIP09634.1 MAG: ATPase [Sulfurimonas sp. CG23_combo_of_CG06-09_8_20_14_all_36_33]PIS26179.1 MAG: ATPase [Sulfurimonas sp. CG08_land_8_20_14_0_20_36_33]PIU34262.1 MAG: ATPase [Sulfurimonas sp. CG07_land_8_20_14_0_80_36_56]PIV02560.1 MAG: ATPase [Sulfurimonas sp. CG03_land_8_20_14_0_80_36_25]PIV34657.1 MAG: ATPase [Sulfurimonas sp. CG02_land_8_20_14_3_00_36_67]PIV61610.1 MAG: ATP
MYKRSAENILKEALKISPSVLLSGARQVGKSTLCLSLDNAYRVFDNLTQREAALHDPIGYIASLPKPITLDEIQKVPEVLEGIKIDIDKNRVNGNFLLTGSANVLDMKKAKDTLAGRIIEIPMWPLSQKEVHNKAEENIIDILFTKGVDGFKSSKISYENILTSVVNGGYPEVLKIDSARGKSLWFNSYISTYVERDIRDVGELRDISSFIRFYNIIAPRSCGLLNKSDLASDANLSEPTINNYLSMLEMIYQISLLQPYSSNISKRFIKSQKLFMTDSGIYCHLLGINNANELINSTHKGDVIETFVYSELLKHVGYSETLPKLYHYRTNDKKEIDFIVEKGDKILAIEVKSSQTIKIDAFKHIIDFQNKSSQNILGIVFYGGDDILSFGDAQQQRYALPLNLFF